jgi:hypothetical protein
MRNPFPQADKFFQALFFRVQSPDLKRFDHAIYH